MKKVGIIDNYISNFHSNTYHKLFHEIACDENREEYIITHVYAKTEKSPSTGETTAEWCKRTGAVCCDSVEEVCEAADVIMILAPNNPELHEEWSLTALKYGKPTYIDKTFAPDKTSAKRIADFGRKINAKFWSSSATRFDPLLKEYLESHDSLVDSVTVAGGNIFEIYCIHLAELMNTLMKEGAERVTCRNGSATLIFEVDYRDGRRGFINMYTGSNEGFVCYPEKEGKCSVLRLSDDFWYCFAQALLDFFDSGKAPVSIESTVECIALRSAMITAMEQIGVPVEI